jgi:hypothetical protein
MLAQPTEKSEVFIAVGAFVAQSTPPGRRIQPSDKIVIEDPIRKIVAGRPAIAIPILEVADHSREFAVLVVAAKTFYIIWEVATLMLWTH